MFHLGKYFRISKMKIWTEKRQKSYEKNDAFVEILHWSTCTKIDSVNAQ